MNFPESLDRNFSVIKYLDTDLNGSLIRVQERKGSATFLLRILKSEYLPSSDTDNLNAGLIRMKYLDHPNIAFIRRFLPVNDQQIAVVMDDRPGERLSGKLISVSRNLAVLDHIVDQLGEALEYLHQNNLYFGVLKPETVLIDGQSGTASFSIIDGGLADYLQWQPIPNFSDTAYRTSAMYVGPECITGRGTSYRSDIYAFGSLLYTIATGANPFDANSTAGVVSAQLNRAIESPQSTNPAIDDGLNDFISDLLARESGGRPFRANEYSDRKRKHNGKITILHEAHEIGTAHSLPLKEIQSAFASACNGMGSVLMVNGESGIGKSRLLREVESSLLLSGATLHVIDSIPGTETDSGYGILQKAFASLSKLHRGIEPQMVDQLYYTDFEHTYLMLSDPAHRENTIRRCALKIVLGLTCEKTKSLDNPHVIILKNCHFQDPIFWRFFAVLSELMSDFSPENCPNLWLVETHESGRLAEPSVHTGRYRVVQLIPYSEEQTNSVFKASTGIYSFPEWLTAWMMILSKGIPEKIDLVLSILQRSGIVFRQNGVSQLDDEKIYSIQHFQDVNQLIDWGIECCLSSHVLHLFQNLSYWPTGCGIDELAITTDPHLLKDSTIQEAMTTGWIIRTWINGREIYRIRFRQIQKRLEEQLPTYQKLNNHLKICEKLQTKEDVHVSLIAEHYFEAENRLHGCEYAAKAAYFYRDHCCLEKALFWFIRILDNMPDRNRSKIAEISYDYAKILIAGQDFSDALTALIHAEPILESRFHSKREKADFLLLQGICYLRARQFESARDRLMESLRYLPRTTAYEYRLKILLYLCLTLYQLNEFDTIITLFNTHQKTLPLQEYPYFSGRLMECVAAVYLEQHLYSSAEFFLNESIRLGEIEGDPLVLIDRFITLGRIYEQTSKYRQAEEEYERVITIARSCASYINLCRALCHLSALCLAQHRTEKIEVMLNEATTLAVRLKNPQLHIWSHVLQSSFFIRGGFLDEAEQLLQTLDNSSMAGMDVALSNRIYLNFGLIAERRGQFMRLLDVYNKLLQQVQQQNQPVYIAFAYLYLARAHCLLEHIQQARSYIEKSRIILDESKLPVPDCDILDSLVHLKLGQVKKARKLAMNGLANAKVNSLLHQQADALRMLGLIGMAEKKVDEALSHLKLSLDFYNAEREDFEAAQVYRLLAELYRSIDKADLAKQASASADEIFKKLSAFFYLQNGFESDAIKKDNLSQTPLTSIDLSGVQQLLQSLPHRDEMQAMLFHLFTNSGNFLQCALFVGSSEPGILKLLMQTGIAPENIESILKLCTSLVFERNIQGPYCHKQIQQNESGSNAEEEQLWILPIIVSGEYLAVFYLSHHCHFKSISKVAMGPISEFATSVYRLSQCLERNKTRIQDRIIPVNTEIQNRTIVSKSDSMIKISDSIQAIACSRRPLLISGPVGTGKSFFADVIHSQERNSPLAIIRCSTLINASKPGILAEQIQSATIGWDTAFQETDATVVLKDVDCLTSSQQLELIDLITHSNAALNHSEIDYRFIFTTSKNIRREVQDGVFSEDLYRLISELQIHLPDLTDRKEDIPQLAQLFLNDSTRVTGKTFNGFSPQALNALISYPWPENVSELRNTIESAALFGTPPIIQISDLDKSIRTFVERSGIMGPEKPVLRSIENIEEAHIRAILKGTNGNKLRACELLGISRPTLDRKLEKFGIIVKKKRKR